MPARRRVHAGHELTDAFQTLLTFGDKLTEGGALLMGFSVVNQDTDPHFVAVHLVAAGGSPSDANALLSRTLRAGKQVIVSGPFHAESLATVRAISDDANSHVTIMVTCIEEQLS